MAHGLRCAMNKSLIFALSIFFFGFKFAVPAPANCGHCEEDQAAGDKPAKIEKCNAAAAQCQVKAGTTLEARVACMEKCLKDVGSSDGSGSPYSSKTKDYSKKKAQCPMSKCPKAKSSCTREKCF